ncbi:hypothetical protein P3T76_006231 [Phytophthora citrophthora]|uniref:Crinkler effector protein N-terminal domain-containing protein n=1 Tax=Phytophthora citrophthora TaxID=4793 RepID=A0AAD9GQ92_9STRA|nr:hypothetical protein P3T76_006231 [Phytophthora citrophthora]
MEVLSLQCAIVGEVGSSFDVEIDNSAKVSKLKRLIKDAKMYQFPADEVQLFLAKQPVEEEDGTEVVPVYHCSAEETKEESLKWLPEEHRAAVKLVRGEPVDYISVLTTGEQVLASKTLATWFYTMNNMEIPSSDQIHVLVVVPDDDSDLEVIHRRKLTSLGKLLKDSEVNGELPTEGGFLGLFDLTDDNCGDVMDIKVIDEIVGFTTSDFYIRKEILCVLENFKKTYHDGFHTGTAINKQFVLMGSPGIGKSCILALICFYIAVEYNRPVVWFRQVDVAMIP